MILMFVIQIKGVIEEFITIVFALFQGMSEAFDNYMGETKLIGIRISG